ncbi:MAG: PAS domain S-box protein, partial [Alphaproteobacteria bacterium]
MTTEKSVLRLVSALRPWQLSAVCIVLSEFITAGMSLLLRGFIATDYLITGLVASLLVSYTILKLLSFHQTELVERVAERGAELERANTLLENEIESSPDAILVVDAHGRMVSFNRRFLNLWSIPPEIAQSRDDAAALASVRDKLKDPEKFFANVRHLYEHPKEHVRDQIELKDGRILDRYSAGMHDAANKYLGRIWFFRDITERKRAEEQLRKLSQAVEQSSNIILITDTNGTIEYVNPKFTEVTGYAAEEVFGRTPAIFASRLTPSQRYEEFWKSLAANPGWHGEFLNRKKNGDLFWCEEYVAPIRDGDGKITHFVAVETDITERRK